MIVVCEIVRVLPLMTVIVGTTGDCVIVDGKIVTVLPPTCVNCVIVDPTGNAVVIVVNTTVLVGTVITVCTVVVTGTTCANRKTVVIVGVPIDVLGGIDKDEGTVMMGVIDGLLSVTVEAFAVTVVVVT